MWTVVYCVPCGASASYIGGPYDNVVVAMRQARRREAEGYLAMVVQSRAAEAG